MLIAFVLVTLTDIGPPMPTTPSPLKPEPQRTFVDGPAVEAIEPLREWLSKQVGPNGKPLRVRLPVVVKRGAMPHSVERSGFVGTEKGLALELDDTAMGVSLADHFFQACKDAPSCQLMLDGTVEKGRLRILWIQKPKGAWPTRAQVEVAAK